MLVSSTSLPCTNNLFTTICRFNKQKVNLKCDNDETDKDVDHEEGNDDDVDEVEECNAGSIVVLGSIVNLGTNMLIMHRKKYFFLCYCENQRIHIRKTVENIFWK